MLIFFYSLEIVFRVRKGVFLENNLCNHDCVSLWLNYCSMKYLYFMMYYSFNPCVLQMTLSLLSRF